MDPVQRRIDELAAELIRLSAEAGRTIFIAAGLNGAQETQAVLVVSADRKQAREIESAMTHLSESWERSDETHYLPDGSAVKRIDEPGNAGPVGTN